MMCLVKNTGYIEYLIEAAWNSRKVRCLKKLW